jgi:hypothetical protein
MKKQLTIIAVAALMVSVSLLSCIEPTTAGEATTMTITPSNATPAANQPFTLSGTLKAGTTPLPGKTINLNRGDPSGGWGVANTTTTDANGTYTFTRTESPGLYTFQAFFSGDTYAPSNALVKLTV